MSTSTECRLIRQEGRVEGKQGFTYAVGISAETAGAQGIHMQRLVIPPGARAKAHKHVSHETAIFAVSGVSSVWYGPDLEHFATVQPGDYFYIPADMPHMPFNPSADTPAVVIIARTDPNEQESIELLPELEAQHVQREGATSSRTTVPASAGEGAG